MTRPFDHRNLAMLLLQARETLMGSFRPVLKEFSLTEQQWRIMRTLDEKPLHELEAGQIARECCILSPSLTGVLERMERDGLIRRARPLTDQRKLVVSLTSKSIEIIVQIRPRIEDLYRQIEERLGIGTMRDIYRLLDRLMANVSGDEAGAEPAPPPARRPRSRTAA